MSTKLKIYTIKPNLNKVKIEECIEIKKEIIENEIITDEPNYKEKIAINALDKNEDSNDICCSKLASLQHWEGVKRIGMMHLLEEVITVQGLEKQVNNYENQKKTQDNGPTDTDAHNSNENSNENAHENENEHSEEKDTKVSDIEKLTKTTFNTMQKFEDIFELMVKFARPCMAKPSNIQIKQIPIANIVETSNIQVKPKPIANIAKTIEKSECTRADVSNKRKRNVSVIKIFTPPALPERRNKNGEKPNKRPELSNDDGKSPYITIGSNQTTVSRKAWNTINWSLSGPAITRKILMEVFDRNILAFHTLTGKPSPAFTDYDMPKKHQLNTEKVADIIEFMTKYFDMTSREVRSAITTKCADENKMHRQRQQKIKKAEISNLSTTL